jgi:N-acetylmuramoyl-L-alanine amidase
VTVRFNAKIGSLILVAAILGTGLIIAASSLVRVADPCPIARGATVVLDPGHGGEDTGAINGRLVEAELTLDIARRTASVLRQRGLSVALTRDDMETSLGNSDRGRIANACDASAFVSIHLNSFGDPSVNYVKTFWGIAEKDLAFAETVHAAQVATLRPGTDVGDSGVEFFESGALLTAEMPASLTESVFLSNMDEAARLADSSEHRLDEIAGSLSTGILRWFGLLA